MVGLGAASLIVGLTWVFLASSPSAQFDFTVGHQEFLFGIPMGVLLILIGTIAWALRAPRSAKLKAAGWIFCGGLAAIFLVPKNVHGPGMPVILVAVCGWVLSLVLILMAFVQRRGPEMEG